MDELTCISFDERSGTIVRDVTSTSSTSRTILSLQNRIFVEGRYVIIRDETHRRFYIVTNIIYILLFL